jgi:hypothetical protein
MYPLLGALEEGAQVCMQPGHVIVVLGLEKVGRHWTAQTVFLRRTFYLKTVLPTLDVLRIYESLLRLPRCSNNNKTYQWEPVACGAPEPICLANSNSG